MADTYTGICKECGVETDLINGICLPCSLGERFCACGNQLNNGIEQETGICKECQ